MNYSELAEELERCLEIVNQIRKPEKPERVPPKTGFWEKLLQKVMQPFERKPEPEVKPRRDPELERQIKKELRIQLAEQLYPVAQKSVKEFSNDQLYPIILSELDRLTNKHAAEIRQRLHYPLQLDYPQQDIYVRLTPHPRTLPCHKEPWTVQWIEDFLKPGDVLFDVGANVGCYSLIASKFSQGAAKIYAFEPAFSNYPELCHNIVLNHCEDSIIPLPIALSSRTELATFSYYDLTPGDALHSLGDPVHFSSKPAYQQPMMTYRMDDMIEQFQLPMPNHLKIDVDGFEAEVLRGADRVLSDSCLRSLMLELTEDPQQEYQQIIALLESKGLTLKQKDTKTTKDGEIQQLSYYLFTRNQ